MSFLLTQEQKARMTQNPFNQVNFATFEASLFKTMLQVKKFTLCFASPFTFICNHHNRWHAVHTIILVLFYFIFLNPDCFVPLDWWQSCRFVTGMLLHVHPCIPVCRYVLRVDLRIGTNMEVKEGSPALQRSTRWSLAQGGNIRLSGDSRLPLGGWLVCVLNVKVMKLL